MVKNSGKKRRAKRYAAEHGLTYQQAREALDTQHTRDALTSLVAECGSTPLPPGQSPTRIPFGPDSDGQMQWSNDQGTVVYLDDSVPELTEIIGGPGTGKTTMLNRIIAHLATEDPRPESILLFAGDREVGQARKRWADWPQVVVVGRNPNAVHGREVLQTVTHEDGGFVLAPVPIDVDMSAEARASRDALNEDLRGKESIANATRSNQVFVFDDWFTQSDGSLPRFKANDPEDRERLTPADWARWRALWPRRAGLNNSPVIAAFRPGHTSQKDESDQVAQHLIERRGYYGGFIPRDEFTYRQAVPSDEQRKAKGPTPANVTLVPLENSGYVWEHRLDCRRFPAGSPLLRGVRQPWEYHPDDGDFAHAMALRNRLDPDGRN